MRTVVLGAQGSGKTLYTTFKAVHYAEKGYKIYANYHLKHIDYTYINDMHFDINPKEKNIIIIDEVSANERMSRKSWALDRILAQSRKLMGYQDSHLFLTAQLEMQLNLQLCALVEFFTDVYLTKSTKDDMPILIYAEHFPRIGNTPYHDNSPIANEIIPHAYRYLKYYETTEKIDGIDESFLHVILRNHPNVVGEPKKRDYVYDLCRIKYHQTEAESKRVAKSVTQPHIKEVLNLR